MSLSFRHRAPGAPFALGNEARSWGDLLADAAAVARRLEELPGIASGSELMVACADRYVSAVALLACWRAGYVAGLPPNGNPNAIDQLCEARHIPVVLHDGGGPGGLDLRPMLGIAAGTAAAISTVTPLLGAFPAERQLVCVYTSGSTGDHVACLKTAGQILGEAQLLTELFGLDDGTRILATVPPHHIYGLLFGLLVPLMGGGSVVRATPHHAESIAQQAAAWGVNVLVSVPAHLHGLAVLGRDTFPRLGRVFSSGAPLPRATALAVAARLGMPATEVYGSSETGGIAWRQTPHPTENSDRAVGRGDGDGGGNGDDPWRPFPGITVDADDAGVIVVKSPFAPRGEADGADDATTRRFVGADRVALRSDGCFDLRGRADGVVKIGGSRTSTAEVERRLRELPGIRDAAVISVDVPGPRQHELWAVVAPAGRSVAEVRTELLRTMDPISIPRRFRMVDALPREDNGKLVRKRLLSLFEGPTPPLTPAAETTLSAEGRHATTVSFAADSPYFQGHFDGFPVLPGVVQVNDLVLKQIRARWPDLRVLRRIVALKFRSPIRPDDQVSVEITRIPGAKVAFQLRGAGGGVASSGTCVFDDESARTGSNG